MPAYFLWTRGLDEPATQARVRASAESVLPRAHESARTFERAEGTLDVWSWARSAARGAYVDEADEALTCFDGWIVEDEPQGMSCAAALGAMFHRSSFPDVIRGLDGNWAAMRVGGDGKVWAAVDRFGTDHIYYGQRAGVIAVSNRAILVAIALAKGSLPSPRPEFFAWWLSSSMSNIQASETPWEDVKGLSPREYLCVDRGSIRTITRSEPFAYRSWEECVTEFRARSAYVRRMAFAADDLPIKLALTGGKDSRAVLSGLLMSGAVRDVDAAFIRTRAGHPDAYVAEALARRYGLEFENDGVELLIEEDLFDRVRRHLVNTECVLHAWDLKAWVSPPCITLNGHFGETYRSHFVRSLLRPWSIAAQMFTNRSFVDQHDLLDPSMVAYITGQTRAWLDEVNARHVPVVALRDTWHREARMWQWAANIHRGDQINGPVVNLLPSARLLAKYKQLSLLHQRSERVHFELIRAADDELWQVPFANATWQPSLIPQMRRKPPAAHVGRSWPEMSRQLTDYRNNERAIRGYLLESGQDAFFDVFRREGVESLIRRFDASPDDFKLKAIFGLLGARVAMREGIAALR